MPTDDEMEDLFTPLQQASRRLRFHAGDVGPDGQPLLLPKLPKMSGPESSWHLIQWQHPSYLMPDALKPTSRGSRRWQVETPDGHSAVRIERHGKEHAYALRQENGSVADGGGTNLFLATNVTAASTDFGMPVELRLTARLSEATISYDTPAAETTGAVQAMAFVGMGLMFQGGDPATPDQFVFMQVPITVSRPVPPGPGIVCSLSDGAPNLLYAPDAGSIPFRPQADAWSRCYDLTGFVTTMLSEPYPCGGKLMQWHEAQKDPATWRLTGLYVGLELHNRDTRTGAASAAPQGQVAATLEIRELSVRRRKQAARPT